MTEAIKVEGILWYQNAQDYDRFLKVFSDHHLFPRSYSAWRRQADELFERAIRDGTVVVKVVAIPCEFVAWAKATHHSVDASGRRDFSRLKARSYAMQTGATRAVAGPEPGFLHR